MSLKLGNQDIASVKLGSQDVSAIYKGADEVWSVGGDISVGDVFSTYLYAGTSAIQPIVNGVDLDGEGGLVWTKTREVDRSHFLFDTERGGREYLSSDLTAASDQRPGGATFNSDGFTLDPGDGGLTNFNNRTYASWTFRKAKNFFDIVTYTGDGGAGREIPHSLGCVPGFMVVKKLNADSDWTTYHRGMGATHYAPLNDTDPYGVAGGIWSNTEPTETNFTVGDNGRMNADGDKYVAYLFAHDDSAQSIIRCGIYKGNGAAQEIELGFGPQFLLTKNATAVEDWCLIDTARGMTGVNDPVLLANEDIAEVQGPYVAATSTGFRLVNGVSSHNESGQDYIYMAIRKPDTP